MKGLTMKKLFSTIFCLVVFSICLFGFYQVMVNKPSNMDFFDTGNMNFFDTGMDFFDTGNMYSNEESIYDLLLTYSFGAEDEETIQSILSDYPEYLGPKEAVDIGCFVVVRGNAEGKSKKVWDKFYANSTKGKDAAVLICQYTDEGDPILTYVSFMDGSFYSITDTSRDTYGGPDPYYSGSYKFLNQFKTDGQITAFLSDFDYRTLESYYSDTEANREKSTYLFSVRA